MSGAYVILMTVCYHKRGRIKQYSVTMIVYYYIFKQAYE